MRETSRQVQAAIEPVAFNGRNRRPLKILVHQSSYSNKMLKQILRLHLIREYAREKTWLVMDSVKENRRQKKKLERLLAGSAM
jgi:hypothetical protein